jgi:DNA-binding GntR family transcriptional regulator
MSRPGRARLSGDALADLPSLAPMPTAAERAAQVIRDSIFEGRFRPGTALPETALAQALQISRNTVREAFRLLMSDHLLTHEAHKGVTVRSLTVADVKDIYRNRRMLEMAAIELLAAGSATLNEESLRETVAEADEAGARGDWVAAGTANLRFHSSLVAVHGSDRMNEFFRRLMTEMRLGFLALDDSHTFHAPYLERNRAICDLLAAGQFDAVRAALDTYLDDATRQVGDAVAALWTRDAASV